MKLSDAILKGMERFPRQAVGAFQEGEDAACVNGCANWALTGRAIGIAAWVHEGAAKFEAEYGCALAEMNDAGTLREDIVGMLQAIGE